MTKYNNEVIRECIADEGIGYAVTCAIDFNRIGDPKLAKIWRDAEVALDKIQQYLKVY